MNHRFFTVLVFGAALLVPRPVFAHGLFGHVHVTGWAAENLPPGDLRDIFRDPEVFNALLMGATFPDTGYALGSEASRTYGEHAHWEPFVEDFIQRMRTVYQPPYDTLEEKKLIAFLLGCASHGMQDELFDSTVLYEMEQRDGPSQEASDPGTDAFLVADGHARLYPIEWVPMDDLLPLFADLGQPITSELIMKQVRTVLQIYVNDGFGHDFAKDSEPMYAIRIPWMRDHYLDPSIPGSLRAEIAPTAAYMQAIWDRLHDRFDESNLVIHTWPDAPRRLREADHASVASWVTLIFGKGVLNGTATGSIVDSAGVALPMTLHNTRWEGAGYSRLVRFLPDADYVPGESYVATMAAGRPMVDGSITTEHTLGFQVECTDAGDDRCPPLPTIRDPLTEQPPKSDDGCSVGGPTSTRGFSFACLLAAFGAIVVRARRRPRRG